MVSPQLENGYTKVANEILEVLALQPLSGTQWRILMVIFRYTYGFNRKEHSFSINFLIKAMGLKNTQYKQVCRELKRLVDMRILVEVEKPGKNNSRRLCFNKNYSLWTNKATGLNRLEDKIDQREGTKKTREPLDDLDHQEKNILNQNLKQTSIDDLFEKIWSLYPRKKGKGQVSKTQKTKLYRIGLDELIRAIERYKKEIAGKDEQYVMYGSTFFNSGYVDYLDANYQDKAETKPNEEYRRLKELVNGGQSTGV